jgi:hypothetical protein
MKNRFRIGRREGQNLWQIKEAPGWRVAHQCSSLAQAAEWLRLKGVDLSTVPVVSTLPGFDIADRWPTLAEAIR